MSAILKVFELFAVWHVGQGEYATPEKAKLYIEAKSELARLTAECEQRAEAYQKMAAHAERLEQQVADYETALKEIIANPGYMDFHIMRPGEKTDKEIARSAMDAARDVCSPEAQAAANWKEAEE